MTDHKLAAALKASGTVTPVPYTRAQLMEHVAVAFGRKPRTMFNTLRDVEDMKPEVLRATKTAGTIFAEAEKALNAADVPTDGTVGRIMDVLSLSQDDVHYIACFCHEHSATMDGETAAFRFRELQAQ